LSKSFFSSIVPPRLIDSSLILDTAIDEAIL
jgi:hypothetical protein